MYFWWERKLVQENHLVVPSSYQQSNNMTQANLLDRIQNN